MKQFIGSILLLVITLLAAGCASGTEEVAATVERQVALALTSTVAAVPTATGRPTYTPRPTQAEQPTYTPLPTLTSAATLTSRPTYTPEPTLTMPPTPTPTRTPAHTAVPPTATQPTQSSAQRLLQEVNDTIAQMEAFLFTIPPRCIDPTCRQLTPYPDCPTVVGLYDAITAPFAYDLAGATETEQFAYTKYQAALEKFVFEESAWVDQCREAIPLGRLVYIDLNWGSILKVHMREAVSLLREGKQALEAILPQSTG
ncbi:MAG: hypothetical protein L0332_01290 [Chloroflexi bacterium]|nr:hypothetical protein [Chloroflexota bacterium]MCI0577426.1 hypothetical protein [Chloroflexota bacterium]MCI0649482.1 hypothetical protein [Chloroflexota bacterium]MCI0725356.1 hypothetical protein [Chloroflexota bacterium]